MSLHGNNEPVALRPTNRPAAPSTTNQQPPRPAYKQQPPSQQSHTYHQPHHPQQHQPAQTPPKTQKRGLENDFHTNETIPEPQQDEEEEKEDIFPVKKKRPRAVVY